MTIFNLCRPKFMKKMVDHCIEQGYKAQSIRHMFETVFRLLWVLSDKNFRRENPCWKKIPR
jgi:hypothetical protein